MQLTTLKSSKKMPVMFVGHGSPMFAITDNPYRKVWAEIGKRFEEGGFDGTQYPVPQLIICVSAHWLTHGWAVTGMQTPKTIHDFGGFPQALFDVQYPAPGAPEAAREIAASLDIAVDPSEWGFDHGTWSVLKNMFPKADIPVIQLSLNWDAPPAAHFGFAKKLRALRDYGVLIVGSGQLVHNLGSMDRRGIMGDGAEEVAPYDWAQQFDDFTKACIDSGDLAELANFQKLGAIAKMSHPTYEHYLPVLYPAACVDEGEPFEYFNDVIDMGSMALRSVIWG